MKFKKIILTVGSITTVAAPVAAVISCGTSSAQYSESDLLKMSNLKSSEAHSKLQDLWLASVLKSIYTMDGANSSNLDILKSLDNTASTTDTAKVGTKAASSFKEDFKNTLIWVLKNKLFASKDALSQIYQSLKANAPESLINDTTLKSSIDALDAKIFDRQEIEPAVKKIFATKAWESIFYNYKIEDVTTDGTTTKETTFNPSILGVKDLVLKMLITKNYLKISSRDYGDVLPEEKNKLSSKFKDSSLINEDSAYFPLVVSVMNSRLAYKTSIELDASKSKEFIVSNIDNNLKDQTEIDQVFNYDSAATAIASTNSKFASKLTYTIKHQTRVDSILAKVPAFNQAADKTIGFQGLSSLPTGEDNLDTNTVESIKLVKDDANARDGFVVDEKLVDKDIRYTDKDKTKVQLDYYTSLMPVFNSTTKSLEFMQKSGTDLAPMDEGKLDILMNEDYSKDSSLFSTAIKYYTSTAKDDDDKYITHLLINVTNDWARNYYIDEGLTYINKEDEK